MANLDKLLARVRSVPTDMRFDELRRVLEAYGYKMTSPHGGGSHYTFRKAGHDPITVPKHRPIKQIYVKMVKDALEDDNVEDD